MNGRKLLLFVLLAAVLDGWTQIKRYDTDFTLSQKNFVLTLPIQVERNQIYLPVTIGGRSYRFKLDTGASQGVIYDDVDMPGLRELGYIKSEDATGASRHVTTVELPPMTLDSLTVSHYKVQRMRRSVVRRGEDGIIGFALFHHGLAACIDTRAGLLTLTDRKGYFKNAAGEALKYRLKWHVPYVTVSPFEGAVDVALFDTGSPMLYAPNSERLAHMEATVPAVKSQIEGVTYGRRTMGHFGAEQSHRITLLRLERLRWGRFDFQDVRCATVHGGSHIGALMLHYGALVINPFRRQLVFQPYDDATSCQVVDPRSDIVLVEADGKAMVGMVMEQGRAWQAGFRPEQIILKVDGRPLNFAAFNAFRWVEGQEYTFTLLLPTGVQTTIRACWPLYYNQPSNHP